MARVTPFLWFDGQLGAALETYSRIFGDAAVLEVTRLPAGAPGAPADGVLSARFTLGGQEILAMNGGSQHAFTPAFSLFIACADQAEVDHYWDALLDGGQASQCGWLTDRFGLTWQVVPDVLGELLSDPDQARAGRVMSAMLGMVKLDVAALVAAAQG